MKQNLVAVIAVLCVIVLVIASFVSIGRAKHAPKQPQEQTQTEQTSEQESESESLPESEAERETQPDSEGGAQSGTTAETEPAEIGGMPFVAYTGEAHAGTGIAYRGEGEMAKYVIVIDAGHQTRAMGEKEPIGPGATETKAKVTGGTQGSFTRLAEHELNLRVALALRDLLVEQGYTVVMVRETGEVEISNAERAQMANAAGAHVNIRIHANGDNDASVKGAMAVCQTPENPYNASIYQTCRALSDAVLEAFCDSTGIEKRRVWETDTMTGTNWASVPTTIIEMGFMTNAEDEAVLAANDFAAKAAEGLANGIAAYLQANAPIEQPTETESSTQEPTTKPEQGTYPVSKYDINFQREAELGQTFTDVETTVEFTGTAWVRTEPSTQGGDATKMMNIKTYEGKRVTCIGLGENWHRVLIDGKVYYVSAAYLKVVEE
jgi:N-acetylmuramoyl-L-alanine amidase